MSSRGWVAGVCAAWALAGCGGGGGGGDAPPVAPAVVVAPSIGTQPANAKVVDGSTATFSVSAAGSSLSYQWKRDGKSIAGATGASYTTPVLHMVDDKARFEVVVSGPNASVTSSVAALTVTPIALNLTTQPAAQSAKDGDVASFDVAATGSEPIQYQWQRNGVAIAGADKATYTTPALVLADDAAVFTVVVTNPAGSVTSQAARLNVAAVPPRVVTVPESVTTTDGATVTFNVTAAGSAPLAYQWLRNGSAISGATDASYTTALTYAGSGDRYTVQITNSVGQTVSAAAIATVNPNAPAISVHPADASIATGGSASFTVKASGTAPLSYQWQQSQDEGLSWTAIPGATSATYSIANATLADAKTKLRASVTNPAATLNSNAALLTVRPNVRILAGATGGMGYADGKGAAARFFSSSGLSADDRGNVYIVDTHFHVVRRVAPDGSVSLFLGQPKVSARVNGALAEARLASPTDIVVDRFGTIYVAETCAIRRVKAGQVSTFIGGNVCDTQDGTGESAAVSVVTGMTTDAAGNLFIAEYVYGGGQVVRKITPAGVTRTIAGSTTESGKVDGAGTAARFMSVGKLTLDAAGNLYVSDRNAVRLITPAGQVSTFAGVVDAYGQTEGSRTEARFGYINGLAFDAAGNLFVSEGSRISRISVAGNVVTAVGVRYGSDGYPTSIDGPGSTSSAGISTGLTAIPGGNFAFFDMATYTVRTLTAGADVATLAGGGAIGGFVDGVGAAARMATYGYRCGLVPGPADTLLFADSSNRRIRRFALKTNLLDTLAGNGNYANADGPAATASFTQPEGLAADAAGNLYVAEPFNVIRKISAAGTVSTVAGKWGEAGSTDGVGAAARFNFPVCLVVDSKGRVIVADSSNYVLRRMTPDGVVTTLIGKAGEQGYVNGFGAEVRLGSVRYMAIDPSDNIYFTDGNNTIRKLSANGEVSTFAGAPYADGLIDDIGAFARFSQPTGLALDERGNLYVADSGNNAIRRITPTGQVTTVVGGNAATAVLRSGLDGSINQPMSIAVTRTGRLIFVSEGALVGD